MCLGSVFALPHAQCDSCAGKGKSVNIAFSVTLIRSLCEIKATSKVLMYGGVYEVHGQKSYIFSMRVRCGKIGRASCRERV